MLDVESQLWLRTVQLEVLKSISVDRTLLRGFFVSYDMRATPDPASKVCAFNIACARTLVVLVHVRLSIMCAFQLEVPLK